jgi:hypothetical protein
MSDTFEAELPQLNNALLPLHSQVATMKDRSSNTTCESSTKVPCR